MESSIKEYFIQPSNMRIIASDIPIQKLKKKYGPHIVQNLRGRLLKNINHNNSRILMLGKFK